jgi:two-component system sensor histidine kinase/response regulator
MSKPTILLVDDEQDNVDALERLFRSTYNVLKATSGQQALRLLDEHRDQICLIMSDQRMPQMTGVELLTRALEKAPEILRLLITGYTDIASIIDAVNAAQIYRYLTKPWDPIDLQNTVREAARQFQLQKELTEKNLELQKAYDELKTLDQAKNQFMILINHELKTPLTSILSFVELLKETKLDDEQALCVSRISRSSDRLKQLIQDVLLVISSETKNLKIKAQPFEAMLLQVPYKQELQQLLKQKNLQIQFQWVDHRILGDLDYLRQVLERLVHNAAKFGFENSLIEVKSELVSPHRVRISVSNDGAGISEKVIDKILKPFFLDEDVMNHSTGMGLGLTVCHSLLKAHQSQIQIQNQSSGVTVSFEIPCL